MTSPSDQLRALIRYRIDQAHETLGEAEILLAEHAFRGTINRAYYAMFYSVLALLAIRQLDTSKHSGAISLFDREFVKPGHFPRDLSRSLHLAFNQRQSYDYGEIAEIEPASAAEVVDNARVFIKSIVRYIEAEGYHM